MKHYILICVLGLLLVASLAHAEDRYLRYRVLSPAVPTIATSRTVRRGHSPA